jgi:hypothetical protein
MERTVIRDCHEASMPPRISLRSIRATLAEMIDAGARVLLESGAVETPMEDFDRGLVQKIFLAMFLVQKSRS